MKKIRLVGASVFVLFCACVLIAQGQTLKRVSTKTDKLDFGVGGTVAIMGAPSGSIRVEAAERNEIEITAEITLEAANEADLAALEKVTGFITDESPGRIAINSVGTNNSKYVKSVDKKFPKRLVGLPFSIDYVVKVPRYCDLQIDAGKGDLTVSGIEGALRINGLETNAALDLVGGGLTATFQKGNIIVKMPDRNWRGSGIDIALANGEMEAYFPVNLNADFDASILRTGRIENGLLDLKPRVRSVKFTEQSISAKAGLGGISMKFTVGDGTLRLKTIGKD
ncbi:MAG TPA: hypothetical protein VEV84_11620 [Pyrinomonadaceae bacterium]|nr:hypothetical protein [Pyrinomonadaceae bacterium]